MRKQKIKLPDNKSERFELRIPGAPPEMIRELKSLFERHSYDVIVSNIDKMEDLNWEQKAKYHLLVAGLI